MAQDLGRGETRAVSQGPPLGHNFCFKGSEVWAPAWYVIVAKRHTKLNYEDSE